MRNTKRLLSLEQVCYPDGGRDVRMRFSFFGPYSKSIKYTTAEFIPTQTAGQLAKCLMEVVYGYARGGFVVNLMLMDMEFDKIRDVLPMVEVNTTAAREHVP